MLQQSMWISFQDMPIILKDFCFLFNLKKNILIVFYKLFYELLKYFLFHRKTNVQSTKSLWDRHHLSQCRVFFSRGTTFRRGFYVFFYHNCWTNTQPNHKKYVDFIPKIYLYNKLMWSLIIWIKVIWIRDILYKLCQRWNILFYGILTLNIYVFGLKQLIRFCYISNRCFK